MTTTYRTLTVNNGTRKVQRQVAIMAMQAMPVGCKAIGWTSQDEYVIEATNEAFNEAYTTAERLTGEYGWTIAII